MSSSAADQADRAPWRTWTVPGYAEVRRLGSGGFGEVVLGTHLATGTAVAIKYLHQELRQDAMFSAMFRSEAGALGEIADPHVVRLYEYVEAPAGAAIVMELVDGVSLEKILRNQGKTTPQAALVVLFGSLLGLAAAHARGVIHRDYKPANVLVNGHGVSKLTDFGIAARAGDRPQPTGTLRYMPPEQFEGAPASPAGDVYAATVTFYECLTGHVPFGGQTSEELYDQHRSDPVPMEPVPEPLRPVIARGMAKNPLYRPSNAAFLAAELRDAATGSYGRDWEEQGRSHLGEAALLLALLWPSAGTPAISGLTVERVPLHQTVQGGSREVRQPRIDRHRWHIRHMLHLEHLAHLRARRAERGAGGRRRRLNRVIAGVTAVAVVAAVGSVLLHRRSALPPGPAQRAVITEAVAVIPATLTSAFTPVSGDVYVQYHDGGGSFATIKGTISNALPGEVVRLYARHFPYTGDLAHVASLALTPAGGTAAYSFRVSPALATRYQVRLFGSATATAPLASSVVRTIYALGSAQTRDKAACSGYPVCHMNATFTVYQPPSVIAAAMAKREYLYIAYSAAPPGSSKVPTPTLYVLYNGGTFTTKRIASNAYRLTISFSYDVGDNPSLIDWQNCTQDREASTGGGLPGAHGCGAASFRYPIPYLG